jgi:acetolactate synthase small subunit
MNIVDIKESLNRQAEQQLQDVKDKIAASEYAQSTTIETKALEDAEYKARHEADALKHQLDTWAKEYAGDNGRPNAKTLVEKLKQQNIEIQKLKMTLEVLEPVSKLEHCACEHDNFRLMQHQ